MKYFSKELTDWAIEKIKRDFPDDIALLIGHKHWKIAPDGDETAFNFFVPSTDRGYNLARTFIIGDIGYDLFPMSWDRLGKIAGLTDSLTTCLADGVILYARNEEEKERFVKLQKQLKDNLSNREFTYRKGLEKISIAMELFQNMLFENSLSHIRKASAFVASYLAEAVAFVNGTYFKRGPENQAVILSELTEVPDGFIDLCRDNIRAKTIEESKDICYRMLAAVRDFFSVRKPDKEPKIKDYNFEDLADWYEECSYWFRRLYYYSGIKDAENCFAWGCRIQRELDYVTEEFGLEEMELMNVFNPEDLSTVYKRAEEIEQYIVSEINKHGVTIQKFESLEQFLKQNG